MVERTPAEVQTRVKKPTAPRLGDTKRMGTTLIQRTQDGYWFREFEDPPRFIREKKRKEYLERIGVITIISLTKLRCNVCKQPIFLKGPKRYDLKPVKEHVEDAHGRYA